MEGSTPLPMTDVKVTELVYIEDGYIVSYKEMKGKPVRKV